MLNYVLESSSQEALDQGKALIASNKLEKGIVKEVHSAAYVTESHFHFVTHLVHTNGSSAFVPLQFDDEYMDCASGTFSYNDVDYCFSTRMSGDDHNLDEIHRRNTSCSLLEGAFRRRDRERFREKFEDYEARVNVLYARFFPEINTPDLVLNFSEVESSDMKRFEGIRDDHSVSKSPASQESSDSSYNEGRAFTRIRWRDIGGLFTPKREIRTLLDDFYDPKTAISLGLNPSENGGVFFFGNSGNGKTLAAEAIATELASKYGVDFFPIFADYSIFANVYRGGEARATTSLFDRVRGKVSEGRKVLLFLDEMQSMGQREGGHLIEIQMKYLNKY